MFCLREEGAQAIVAGARSKGTYTGKNGYPVTVDTDVDNPSPADMGAVVPPDGYAPDRLRRHRPVLDLVREVFQRGKVVNSSPAASLMPVEGRGSRGALQGLW